MTWPNLPGITKGLRNLSQSIFTFIQFRGGAVTVREPALLPPGAYSDVKNMRPKHPGFEKRKGQRKQHSVADSTNKVLSLYQFSKAKRTERHLFAQMSDGDILEAANDPPAVTTGVFGSEVFSGSASQVPASWSTIRELMLHSNGVDQHKIYAGTANYVKKFVKYDASAAPPSVPEEGIDYSIEVTDGLTATHAVLSDLDTYANNECVFICSPVQATRLTWTIPNPNGTASVSTLKYFKSDNSWTDCSISDGTEVLTLDVAPATAWAVGATITGATSTKTCVIVAKITDLTYQISNRSGTFTLGEVLSDGTYAADQGAAHPTVTTLGVTTGTMTWTAPTDEIPSYMYGVCGFWYELIVSVKLDAEVFVSGLTYGSSFQSLVNVWDGNPEYAIEAQFYDQSAGIYKVFASDTIEIDSMTHSADDTVDRVYFNYPEPLCGIYVNVGEKPNTTAATVVGGVKTWTGAAFASVGTITDGTDGLSHSGWITWPRAAAQPTQFQTSKYYSYWYYFWITTATMNADVIISIETMPYFDIEDLGHGLTNCPWKDRVSYNFDRHPHYIYISAEGDPMVLNGDDFGILKAGDGRSNKVVCQKRFANDLMVWQAEKGRDGGCVTIFEGYAPENFGRLVLSTKVGTMNSKSVAVVDGVLTSTATEEKLKTIAFFLSRYGVIATDGRTVTVISDDIQNYFDPKEAECIRYGYEAEMWLEHDTSDNILKIGLVSGAAATLPNVFPVFDLVDKVWYFDTPAQELSCMEEVEAASGATPIVQVGGGVDDGTIYQLNYGTNDVTTAIDEFLIMELDGQGLILMLRELILRLKTQAAGNCTITPYRNAIAGTAMTISMIADTINETIKRERRGWVVENQHISLKFQNNVASQNMYLLDVALLLFGKEWP